jgi:hypothetical protein
MFYKRARALPQSRRKLHGTWQVIDYILRQQLRSIRAMKLSPRAIGAVAALLVAGASLAGCVYYPSGYAPGYYAPAYYGPPVGVVIGGGWGHRWR